MSCCKENMEMGYGPATCYHPQVGHGKYILTNMSTDFMCWRVLDVGLWLACRFLHSWKCSKDNSTAATGIRFVETLMNIKFG
ncbi:hypothetical protein VTO42DRAFT_8483 [Malbranchea cinnamomea]